MEFVSTSNSYLGLNGMYSTPHSAKGWTPAWDSYESGSYQLKALPIAEKRSETRYRVFSADAKLTLLSAGDEYHVAVWEVSEEPIAILEYHTEMQSIPPTGGLAGIRLQDRDAWLD